MCVCPLKVCAWVVKTSFKIFRNEKKKVEQKYASAILLRSTQTYPNMATLFFSPILLKSKDNSIMVREENQQMQSVIYLDVRKINQ